MLKPEQIGDIESSKNDLICELFVRTADENYIAARWCARNQLNVDFLWLSVHALEKYLKAVLLINGHSAKNSYGHDIVQLYADIKKFAEDLLPNNLSKPHNLEIYRWYDKTPEDFIQDLFKNGNADNRYMIHGYRTESQDLHMLDRMVFVIRRLICPLDGPWAIGCKDSQGNKDPNMPNINKTNRDMLLKDPIYCKNMFKTLDDLIHASKDSPKRRAALNLNMEFAPHDYPHLKVRAGSSARKKTIEKRILEPLEGKNADQIENGIEIADWFLQNIQIPSKVKTEIKNAITSAKSKLKLISDN